MRSPAARSGTATVMEGEELFRATLEQSVFGVGHRTLDGRWLWFNRRWSEIVGFASELLLTRNLSGVMDPADVAAADELDRAVASGERGEYSIDRRYIRDSGIAVWARFTLNVVRDAEGQASHCVAFLEDITERKTAEQQVAAQYAVAKILGESLDAVDAPGQIIEAICRHLNWTAGSMWVVDEQADVLRCVDSIRLSRRQNRFVPRRPDNVKRRGEGIPGKVWQTAEPEWIADVAALGEAPRSTLATATGVHGAFAFPVISGERVLGVMEFFSPNIEPAEGPLREAIAVMGRELGSYLEQKRLEQRRAEAERAIRESEERYRALTEAAVEGILIHDQGIVLDANPAFATMLGYELPEVLGANAIELLTAPESREKLIEEMRKPVSEPYEARGVRKDGSRIDVEIAARAITYHGRPARVAAVRDITDRKRLEERGRQLAREHSAREAAEGAERRSTFLAEASRVLGFSFDYHTTIAQLARLAVPALADYCAVDVAEGDAGFVRLGSAHADPQKERELASRLAAFRAEDVSPSHPVMKALHGESQLVTEVTEAGMRAAILNDEQFDVLRSLDPNSLISVPMECAGKVLGALTLISSDESRRFGKDDLALAEELGRRAALAIENARLYDAAQQATLDRDEMLSVVAHDLRNPLSTIFMGSELLLEMVPESDQPVVHGQLEILRRAAERMNRLIQDLLDVRRLETGKLRLEPKAVPVSPVVREAVELLRPIATARSLQLSTEVHPGAPPMLADVARIQQVLSNLVGNAIKFTPAGGQIWLRAEPKENSVQFAVVDTGPGIATDALPHIFGRFWQEKTGDRRGIGLGLTIAKGIVEGHGGRIWVESQPGAGSSFYFTVPTATAHRS